MFYINESDATSSVLETEETNITNQENIDVNIDKNNGSSVNSPHPPLSEINYITKRKTRIRNQHGCVI